MMTAAQIETYIAQAVAQGNTEGYFRQPLVAFSAADDPRYGELKTIIGEHHNLPGQCLPGARTVVSFFIPFTRMVVEANRRETVVSEVWAATYVACNKLIAQVCQGLIAQLEAAGHQAGTVAPTHTYDPATLKAAWSHKSAACIAGLGQFGRNHLIITEKGCAGRFGTVFTDWTPGNAYAPAQSEERCLAKLGGSCSYCLDACPVDAWGSGTLDKFACQDQLATTQRRYAHLGRCDSCGKCAVGPCAYYERSRGPGMPMSKLRIPAALLAILLLAGCGGAGGGATTAAPVTQAPTTEAPTAAAPATQTEAPTTAAEGQPDWTAIGDYVREHTVTLEALADQPPDYAGLDGYDFYLLGEAHGMAYAYEAELAMIEYFVRVQGARHIIMESGYADGQLVNHYLETGDESGIRSMLQNLRGTYAGNGDTYAFYEGLYALNQSLPEGDRLHVTGVDIQHQFTTAERYMLSLLEGKEEPEALREPLAALRRGFSQVGTPVVAGVYRSLEEQAEAWQALLGEGYEGFRLALLGIVQGHKVYTRQSEGNPLREEYLIENFVAAVKRHPGQKVVGVFGSFHTALGNETGYSWQDYDTMAYALDQDHYPGQVAAIEQWYHNCAVRRPDGSRDTADESTLGQATYHLWPADISFCPTRLEAAPLAACGLAKNAQFFLFIRNSPAAADYSPPAQ